MITSIIDNRNSKDIYNQIVEMAKYYVPEWSVSEEDVGTIFAHIFSSMFSDTIQRFNNMPYKNFIFFLNLLGADTLPIEPSKGYITVKLSSGAEKGVIVKKGTHLYGLNDYNDKLIFETKDDMYAIDNNITEIFCKSDIENTIVKVDLEKPFKLFDFYESENLQKYRIIFSEEYVLNITNKSQISLTLINEYNPYLEIELAENLSNDKYVKWEFLSESGWKKIDNIKSVSNQININVNSVIPLTKYNDINGRWLSCTIIDNSNFSEICFTDLKISSKSDNIKPETMYSNDLALTKEDFFPFGEKYSIYNDFYINSKEVFSKRGAIINIDIVMDSREISLYDYKDEPKIKWKSIMSENDIKKNRAKPLNIERVIWEYWNGNGWARLFQDNRYEDIFKLRSKKNIKIVFVCPDDIEESYIGADYGLWIRARIINISNALNIEVFYNSPFIEKINLSYSYGNRKKNIKKVFIEKDLETLFYEDISGKETKLYTCETKNPPSVYIAVHNKIMSGPVKIYFQKQGKTIKNPPPLIWEYWGNINGVSKWIEVKVLDKTDFFKQSGIITFNFKYDFKKLKLFGLERYWIRIVNTDRQYDRKLDILPLVKDIHFNTTEVIQKETMEEEYFYIEPEQQNKVCILRSNNIIIDNVWVNEVDNMLLNKADNYDKYMSDSIESKKGNTTSFWIKWRKISDINEASAEDRVYLFNSKNGSIVFGNGKNGKIPPSQSFETIKIQYCLCNGSKGNIEKYHIENFAESVPFVDSVYNIQPILGGCDIENIEDALARSVNIIKHQNKIVSYRDYEYIVKQSDRNIAKVKAISSMNSSTGSIIIVILPKLTNSKGDYFLSIKTNILKELKNKGNAVLTYNDKIDIIEVQYIEFCVYVSVTIDDVGYYQEVLKNIEEILKEYLNPITGNFNGKGFAIGELPTKIKVYNCIKKVRNIKNINSININCYERIREDRKELDYDSIFNLQYAVPINGIHEMDINIV